MLDLADVRLAHGVTLWEQLGELFLNHETLEKRHLQSAKFLAWITWSRHKSSMCRIFVAVWADQRLRSPLCFVRKLCAKFWSLNDTH